MFQTFGVLNNITSKYFHLLEDVPQKKKSLNDSDDEMIIKHINEVE